MATVVEFPKELRARLKINYSHCLGVTASQSEVRSMILEHVHHKKSPVSLPQEQGVVLVIAA